MKKTIGIVLMITFIAGAVFSGIMCAQQYRDAEDSENTFCELQELIKDTTGSLSAEGTEASAEAETLGEPEQLVTETAYDKYFPLYEKNSDFIGWISIDETRIDYPVMQTPEDHLYYLKHSFERKWSDYGVPFLDGNCIIGLSNNLIIYGHHMRNGSMFSDLVKYADQSFCQEHPVIRFDTLNGYGSYEVIAAFRYNTYHENFLYNEYYDMDEETFGSFVSECMSRSLYDTGKTAIYGDQIITLSTCDYTYENGRFVVVAKKIV